MASRDLKKDSVTGEYTETGLDKIQIAYDGVAVIINKEASIEGNNVTNEQLYALYAYGIPIGGISLPVSREDGSGTREAFDEKITDAEGNKLIDLTKFTSGIQIANGTNIVMTDVAGNVAKLGYISMGSLNDTVKAVKYNGVEPTVEMSKTAPTSLRDLFDSDQIGCGAVAGGKGLHRFYSFGSRTEDSGGRRLCGYVRVAAY